MIKYCMRSRIIGFFILALAILALSNILLTYVFTVNANRDREHFVVNSNAELRQNLQTFDTRKDGGQAEGEQFELEGNALFFENKLIVDENETDWRLKRNAPISREELTAFLQTKHSPPSGCKGKNVFLLTFVLSSPYDISRRNAIRDSWGRATEIDKRHVVTVFVMGKHPDSWNHDGVISLNREIEKYRDILRGRLRLDKGIRTSLKVFLGLQFVREHCRRVSYILVVKDTMFVNYRRLVKVLINREHQDELNAKLWIGNVKENQRPIRDLTSSHYISEKQFNESVFPPFCCVDSGFVLTTSAARDLYNAALTRTLFPFIDLFAGVVARFKDWTLVHSDQLFTGIHLRSKACAIDRIVTAVAPDNPDVSIAMWKELGNNNELRKCKDPDIELVLPGDINNEPLLDVALKTSINHPHICFTASRKPRSVFMIVLISSSPRNADMRNAIRRTWGAESVIDGKQIKLMFLLGRQRHETTNMIKTIKTENARHMDIIQANFVDSFQNETLKIILGLKWVNSYCRHATFLYKGDDDMFVNFRSLFRYLKNIPSNNIAPLQLFLGSRIYGQRRFSPDHDNDEILKRFHVSDQLYSGHYYPPYCSGTGYVLSGDVIPVMYREALRTPIIVVADAFQGILAKRIGVEAKGHRGFRTWGGKVDPCALRSNDTMTVHGIGKSAQDILDVWHAFKNETITCKSIWARR